MKINLQFLKGFSFFIVIHILLASCASSTMIVSDPPGATVYLNNYKVGETPYRMTDTKITGTCTDVLLVKEGYEDLYTGICRNETYDVGAIIGGCFIYFPFLWTMKYLPEHYYEMYPYSEEPIVNQPEYQAPATTKEEKLLEIKDLLEKNLITEEEYQEHRKRILSE